MVTSDEMKDITKQTLTTRVNGHVKQQATIDMLIHDIPQLIAYISTFAPLEPGDVIVTGTPGGVGDARTPPEYMFPGDTVEIEITGVRPSAQSRQGGLASARLAPQAELFLHRPVGEGEQHDIRCRLVPPPMPRRHDEDVAWPPLQRLELSSGTEDVRLPASFGAAEDGAVRRCGTEMSRSPSAGVGSTYRSSALPIRRRSD
jgi:hypothetical protein